MAENNEGQKGLACFNIAEDFSYQYHRMNVLRLK